MQTILSPNRTAGRIRPIRLVVIHDMEAPEQLDTAELVARFFTNPARKASAHICADADSLVRCVPDADTAWAAPGANADGLQLELAGYARQSFAGWLDDYSARMLRDQAAPQVRAWCLAYDIPMTRLTNAELAAGGRGIVGHNQVSAVYHKSTHSDPGTGFPWPQFISMVRDTPEQEDIFDMDEKTFRRIIREEIDASNDEQYRLVARGETEQGISPPHQRVSLGAIRDAVDADAGQ